MRSRQTPAERESLPRTSLWLQRATASKRIRRLCGVGALFAAIAEVSVPPVVGYSVAQGMRDSSFEATVWLPIVVAICVAGLLAGTQTYWLSRTTAREMRTLRLTVAEQLVTLPPRTVEKVGVDEALQLYSRYADEVEPLLTSERIRRRVAGATIIASLSLMAFFEWRLLLTVLLAMVASAGIIATTIRGLKEHGTRALGALRQTSSTLGEFLRSVRSAKVYGLEGSYLNRLDADLHDVQAVEERVGRVQGIVDLTVKITSLLALLSIGIVGAALVSSGVTSVARLSGFLAALAVLLGPAAQYVDMLQRRRRAMSALPELDALAAMSRETIDSGATTQSLEPFQFGGGVVLNKTVLQPAAEAKVGPVSLSAERGERICLVGPSGSGKSSILAAIAGFLEVSDGTVEVGGRDTNAWEPTALRAHIAYVEQDSPFIGATIREFVCAQGAGTSTDAELWHLLKSVGLSSRLTDLGLDTSIDRAGTSLSGGERQRLSIVRAIASGRPIILLDEPTGHLDTEAEHAVLQLLNEHGKERVAIIATHSAPIIRSADKIITLATASAVPSSSEVLTGRPASTAPVGSLTS